MVAIKENIAATINLIQGWRTKRKIVVFESDDWGSLRTPSRTVLESLRHKGLLVDDPYNQYDALEKDEDLLKLFDLLEAYSDKKNHHPTFTANCVMANPDFHLIKQNGYREYYYKLVTDTFAENEGSTSGYKLWIKGNDLGVFHPQFHCREHLNIKNWMTSLRSGDAQTLEAFKYKFWSHRTNSSNSREEHFLASFSIYDHSSIKEIRDIVSDGLQIFERLMGFKSISWVAPNFIWPEALESSLSDHGVQYVQGQRKQLIPLTGAKTRYAKKSHFLGQKNGYGQLYLVRNSYFEPFSNPGIDWVDHCMNSVRRAFYWNKPAIISSHRVNYVGRLSGEKRDRNLSLLRSLLTKMMSKWPDIEFLTSDQLGDHIKAEINEQRSINRLDHT